MPSFMTMLAIAITFLTYALQAQAKAVFAHFIVGNAATSTSSDWAEDIALASAAGIDGFALNIASGDSSNGNSLDNAYNAADAAGNFSLFLSFDYASQGAWGSSAVSSLISKYSSRSSQFKVDGKPMVSTFEGTDNAGDWAGIKSSTNAFFMPDWTSLGPQGFTQHLDTVDGAFSWDAWPNGASAMTTEDDVQWLNALQSKPFMMSVSPWFYTNLPQWSKNWVWNGDSLWYDRWQQVLEVDPQFVEILTWNDFGESHYIGPVRQSGIPEGADWYVGDNAHDAWREFLPYFISAYKTGNASLPQIDLAKMVWSHRPNPSSSGSTGGTTGNAPYQDTLPPSTVSPDNISLDVLVAFPADLSVQIGSNTPTTYKAKSAGVNHFNIPFNGQTGNVTYTLTRAGTTLIHVVGDAITDACTNGLVNWNAVVGSATADPSVYGRH
ncbi:hypothetical protein MMC25_006706 [Agyrium rufum]|nr:hypothetical protein [Agyrium rufum]